MIVETLKADPQACLAIGFSLCPGGRAKELLDEEGSLSASVPICMRDGN